MTLQEINAKYSRVPQDLKNTKRWICYSIEDDKKIPRNPLSGGFARTNDPLTWTSFSVASLGCVKNNFSGLGFILGDNYFGIDIDNHINPSTGKKALTPDEFETLTDEFITALNSYAEYSHSGEGVHIICKGKLPEGARRKAGCSIEMYDSVRFFTMTGNVINETNVEERTNEIIPLWEKYLKQNDSSSSSSSFTQKERIGYMEENGKVTLGKGIITVDLNKKYLDDNELISVIRSSQGGSDFIRLFNGNTEEYGGDHSAADLALCQKLAFWTSCNLEQMDRIFRSSGLMRDKWDQKRGKDTYGMITLNKAIQNQIDTYTAPIEHKKINTNRELTQPTMSIDSYGNVSETILSEQMFDEKGDPIIETHSFGTKFYPLTDTGNAERFYDQFGESFRYNTTNKVWMYWDGRTWINDVKGYIKKYADKLIEQLRQDALSINQEMKNAEDEAKMKALKEEQKAMFDNIKRISNKSGKDAMISEFEHLHEIPCESKEFDKHPLLLNTASGIVDLETGKIMPFDRSLKLSKNTNCEVSFDEPKIWLKFLHDIFKREDEVETEELVNCVQKAVGYSLTGLTREQCLFLLIGNGSNGKSTFQEQLSNILGDYAATTPSQTLMQQKNGGSGSVLFSLAKLRGTRFVNAKETDEGEKMSEATVKNITGADTISAAFKYGNEFDYKPDFKIWLSTNNKPIIRGTDLGIWRRLFFFPFERKFTEKEKDLDLPEKLKKENAQILGWAIKGYKLYKEEGLTKPRCIEEAISEYRGEMDIVETYLREQTQPSKGHRTKANDLYEDYIRWTDEGKQHAMNRNKFFSKLIEKGYEKERRSDGFYYQDIRLNTDTSVIVLGKGSAFEK